MVEVFCRAVSWLHLEEGTFVREARLVDRVVNKADRAVGSGYLVAADFCRAMDIPDAEVKPLCRKVQAFCHEVKNFACKQLFQSEPDLYFIEL